MTAAAVVPSVAARARAAVARGVGMARVSGATLIGLGVLSGAMTIGRPLSAGFIVSLVALGCGVAEWKLAGQLSGRDPRAPSRLALNQLVLGAGVLGYALWQAYTITAADIEAVLGRASVARVLATVDPAVLEILLERLQPAVRLLYFVVGGVAVIGCGLTALFYLGRTRALAELAAAEPVVTPPALDNHR